MNVYLKEILIFDKEGKKRNVPFKQGLNIITGNSKTGKSALIEIVDYCLCSSKSTIPQGVITDFGYLFAIVLAFSSNNEDKKFLVLGRKRYNEGGNSKMFFKVETETSNIKNIELSYFKNIQEELIKSGVQPEIEKHLGLNVTNMPNEDKTISASLRNIVSFLFQHQNLIANKHAIFYRFEDYNKRKQVIEQFPIFAGWVNAKYYALQKELDDKNTEIKKIKRLKKEKQKEHEEAFEKLSIYFKNYYDLIGEEFPNVSSIDKLFKLQEKLPSYGAKAFTTSNNIIKSNGLTEDREILKIKLDSLIIKRKNLESSHNYASQYNKSLEPLKSKIDKANINVSNISCPICGSINDEFKEQKNQLFNAKQKLNTELKNIGKYNVSFHKEIDKIKQLEREEKTKIRLLNIQIKEIEKTKDDVKDNKDKTEQIIHAKAKIDVKIELLQEIKDIKIEDNSSKLLGEIELIKKEMQI